MRSRGRVERTAVFALLSVCLLFLQCGRLEYPHPIPPDVRARLHEYIVAHGEPPVQYMVNLFDDHDVVFAGEVHHIEHDPRFIGALFEPLYARGVRILATEFARREDQDRLDSLLTAPEWREQLARDIQFDQSVMWGYQEYVGIYRTAWELNRSLPEGAPPFRILGVNDSPDWSFVKTREDLGDSEVMRNVWRGGGEHLWANVILDAVASGEKVLVYSGIHHAFTRYRQPVVIDGEFVRFDDSRMGNHVYRAIGDRAATVFLHAPWHGPGGYDDDWVHPADGAIDAYMLARPEGPHTMGFDVAGTPFGELRLHNSVYRYGYEDFRLGDFCDGWIYTKPIHLYRGVTMIPGWINEGNIARAREQTPDVRARGYSIEEFNAFIAHAGDARRFCKRLK